MGIFSRKPAAPASQALTLSDFIARAKTSAHYGPYLTKFGSSLTQLNLQALYDRNLRMLQPSGVWGPALAADYNRVLPSTTLLKVVPDDLATLDLHLTEQLKQDVTKATAREVYLQGLKADALAGQLRVRLAAATEPEANYYVAPAARVAAQGAPAVPPRPPRMLRISRAMGWAVGNPAAAEDVRTVFRQAFDAHATGSLAGGGAFPIRKFDTLQSIWSKVVTGAPSYRAVNILQATRYPSSLGGLYVLRNVINDFGASVAPPAQGSDDWYDWALYFFAAIMTSQAFTDGNKRVSRLAYALILTEGGVDFRAPTAALGAELGNM